MTQPPYAMPAPPAARAGQPGPKLGVSITLLVLGAVIGIGSAIAVTVPLVGTFTSREYAAPTHLSLHLRHARYTVYERSGTRSGLGINPGPVSIEPGQVIVTDPDGQRVFVDRPGTTETITRDSTVYTGAVQFDARTTGNYDIRLETMSTRVLITRSLGDAIRSVLVWIGTGAVGAVLFLAVLVMIIVGATRRGRARRATQVGWGPPGSGQAGWGQPAYGQPQWGQAQWGQPQSQYPPPAYPPPAYPPPQYPPPAGSPPPPPPHVPPPHDPWAPR
jgi:hypothetical protein